MSAEHPGQETKFYHDPFADLMGEAYPGFPVARPTMARSRASSVSSAGSEVPNAATLCTAASDMRGPTDTEQEQKYVRAGQNVFTRDRVLELAQLALDGKDANTVIDAMQTAISGGIDRQSWIDAISEIAARDPNLAGEVDIGNMNAIFRALDANKDEQLTALEIRDGARNAALMGQLDKTNAVLSKLIRDPKFQMRVIQRIPYKSLYGDRVNDQVALVEQGEANYGFAANQFNTEFA